MLCLTLALHLCGLFSLQFFVVESRLSGIWMLLDILLDLLFIYIATIFKLSMSLLHYKLIFFNAFPHWKSELCLVFLKLST